MSDEGALSLEEFNILRCPDCGATFAPTASHARDFALHCIGCARVVAVVAGVPRFVDANDDGLDSTARRTQDSFGYEWTQFSDWKPSGATNFADYFGDFDLASLDGLLVLDAGCGMGRHTRQVARYARGVFAVDFSRAIDAAVRNVADQGNAHCVQADLTRLPFSPNTFDFVYSMGVLHHIDDTTEALRSLVRVLKPGGRLRVYLYWKRSGVSGILLGLVAMFRAVTTRLPFSLLRAFCWPLSAGLTLLIIVPYRFLARLGLQIDDWPLAVYAKYPFTVLYNDQFDRFSAPIEKRYTRDQVSALLTSVGLRNVEVHSRSGWIADAVK